MHVSDSNFDLNNVMIYEHMNRFYILKLKIKY